MWLGKGVQLVARSTASPLKRLPPVNPVSIITTSAGQVVHYKNADSASTGIKGEVKHEREKAKNAHTGRPHTLASHKPTRPKFSCSGAENGWKSFPVKLHRTKATKTSEESVV